MEVEDLRVGGDPDPDFCPVGPRDPRGRDGVKGVEGVEAVTVGRAERERGTGGARPL